MYCTVHTRIFFFLLIPFAYQNGRLKQHVNKINHSILLCMPKNIAGSLQHWVCVEEGWSFFHFIHGLMQYFAFGSGFDLYWNGLADPDPILGIQIRIRIQSGQNFPPIKDGEISCLKSSLLGWSLSVLFRGFKETYMPFFANKKAVHKCITVDSAMTVSQNGFCSYKLSIHKKTNIMQIMTKNIKFFI